jgi:NAD(P)-dependent dehydrogenase (short-subunit alcohol dehydrogenase family)
MTSMVGKVALVTGAASGIGRAAAQIFSRERAKVVVVDINDEGGRETVFLVNASGGEALFVHADVTVEADIEAMIGAATGRFGRLDAAFNNVGHPGYFCDVVQTTNEQWEHVGAIDLKAAWLCLKYQIPAMLASGGGAIVNTATTGVLNTVPRMAAFTAFKHGIVGLTKSVAKDYAAQNIRANVLCPGPVATPMLLGSLDKLGYTIEQMAAEIPMKRLAQPEEQAEAAVWLCSPRASYVTGVVLPVDGGAVL